MTWTGIFARKKERIGKTSSREQKIWLIS